MWDSVGQPVPQKNLVFMRFCSALWDCGTDLHIFSYAREVCTLFLLIQGIYTLYIGMCFCVPLVPQSHTLVFMRVCGVLSCGTCPTKSKRIIIKRQIVGGSNGILCAINQRHFKSYTLHIYAVDALSSGIVATSDKD